MSINFVRLLSHWGMLTNFKKPSSVHSKQTKGGADEIGRGRESGEKTEFEPSQLDTQSCCKQYISLVSLRTATMPLWVACSATSAEDTMIRQMMLMTILMNVTLDIGLITLKHLSSVKYFQERILLPQFLKLFNKNQMVNRGNLFLNLQEQGEKGSKTSFNL
jgi:hypothetical protein